MQSIDLLKISDKVFNGRITLLAFDLRQMLEVTMPEGKRLTWSIMGDLDILYNQGMRNRSSVRRKILAQKSNVPEAILVSWDELFSFSGTILQTSDIIVAGRKVHSPAPSRPYHRYFDEDLVDASEIIIQAVESSFWFVYSKDESINDRLRRTYKDVSDTSYRLDMADR